MAEAALRAIENTLRLQVPSGPEEHARACEAGGLARRAWCAQIAGTQQVLKTDIKT